MNAPMRLAYERLLEAFAAANLGFLAVDVYLAHSVNHFASPFEWLPVAFSAAAPLLLLPGLLRGPASKVGRMLGYVVGTLAIVVGVLGMNLHLYDGFFVRHTLRNLVYTAPFVAPLSYTGVGLLLVLNRMERSAPEWARWVIALALGGFIGNFALALLDHAQNGFFSISEWIPVVAAALAVGFLGVVVVRPTDSTLLRATAWLMAIEALVGLLGFGLHLRADLQAVGETLQSRFIHGAPLFAPLLFPNLALLCALGLHRLRGAQ